METCVLLYHVDESMVVQHIWKGEEVVVGIEDHHPIVQLLDRMMILELVFFGAHVHGGR